MKLTTEQRNKLEGLAVALMLEVRKDFLAGGAKALTHWDQLQTRMRRAAATTGTFPAWFTSLCLGLRLAAPSNSTSSAAAKVISALAEIERGDRAWISLINAEYACILARCRLEADRRREQKAQQRGGNFVPDEDAPEQLPDETVEEMYGA